MQASICQKPLSKKVRTALDSSPYLPKSQYTIETEQGHVRIEGKVGSFFQKQMAQEIVQRLEGVVRVNNALQVAWN